MLTIRGLILEGYRAIGAQQNVEFRPGVYCLTGDNRDRGVSSGAGKSTFIKAIACGLFEENDDGSVKDAGINKILNNGCYIGIPFAKDGVEYFTAYYRKHPEGGTAWKLFRWDGSAWVEMAGKNMPDTKTLIASVIKMTYDQFVNHAYAPQYQVAEFIQRTDKERKAIFAKPLGLELCDRWLKTAREMRKEADGEVQRTSAQIDLLQAQLVSATAAINGNEDKLQEELDGFQNDKTWCEAEIARVDGEIAEIRRIDATRERIKWLDVEIPKYEASRDEYALAAMVELPPSKAVEIAAAREEWTQINLKAEQARARLVRVEKLDETCPECERKLPKALREKLATKYHDESNALSLQATTLGVRIRDLEASERERTQQAAAAASAATNRDATTQYLEPLIRERQAYGDIPAASADMGKLTIERGSLKIAYDEAVAMHNAKQVELSGLMRAIEAEAELRRQIAEKDQQLAAQTQRATLLKRCDDAIGDKGFRSFKISSSRGQFNKSLALYLSILTNGEIQAEFVTEVPAADGKKMKQELDIIVKDGDKEGIPIKQYSGGEQATLSLAIIGAFSDLAASQGDCGVNLLLLDEPFANMDPWQEEQACRLFDHLRGDNRCVIVTTNRPEIRDRGHFDGEYRVVKENHVSRIEYYDLSSNH